MAVVGILVILYALTAWALLAGMEQKKLTGHTAWCIYLAGNVLFLLPELLKQVLPYSFVERLDTGLLHGILVGYTTAVIAYYLFGLAVLHLVLCAALTVWFIRHYLKMRRMQSFLISLLLVCAAVGLNLFWICTARPYLSV